MKDELYESLVCDYGDECVRITQNLIDSAYKAGREDAIYECIKLFDVCCTCENCDECVDKEYNKKMCEHDNTITYENIIKKLEQLKEK